jgi:hypothetical protein
MAQQLAASRYGKHAVLAGSRYDWPTTEIRIMALFNRLFGTTEPGRHRADPFTPVVLRGVPDGFFRRFP